MHRHLYRLLGTSMLAMTVAVFTGRASAADDDKDAPFDDAKFVRHAAIGSMFEIKVGEVAQKKTANDQVRMFGARLVEDHAKVGNDLKAVAQSLNVQLPDQLDEKHQKHLDQFANYKGNNFDREFVDAMVKDHEHDIAAFRRASKEAKNDQLRTFATKTLPTLEEHLRIAKELQNTVKK
ncbi:DUF4142 domain-containing protein [Fimbriiglobus ruber]|uniref:Putative exported protein n=1 Tax=Fimbriiglobus ruber TaxID=1908690 RepID=A0A225CZT9_9BACT|nr:DUF4142 domain-containing protein [Fimbriiglobus ruber]OWK34772.1 putative exported protein [Fimbriiglobus ruber]